MFPVYIMHIIGRAVRRENTSYTGTNDELLITRDHSDQSSSSAGARRDNRFFDDGRRRREGGEAGTQETSDSEHDADARWRLCYSRTPSR